MGPRPDCPAGSLLGEYALNAADVRPGFSDASAKALTDYAWRAATLRGTAIVPDTMPDSLPQYLAEAEIGASQLIKVPRDGNVYDALSGDNLALVTSLVRRGHRILPFCVTETEISFAQRLGLPFEQVFIAPTLAVSRRANDKIGLRRLVEESPETRVSFPEYEIVPIVDTARIYTVVEYLLERHGGAFVKHGGYATGDGINQIQSWPGWRAKVATALDDLATCSRPPDEILIDAAVPGVDASVQVQYLDDGPHFVAKSLMEVTGGTTYAGNILSSEPLTPYPWAEDDMVEQAMAAAWLYWLLRYRGWMSFDFRLNALGAKMLEGNGRPTAGMYPSGIFRQLADRGRGRLAVTWHHFETPGDYDFDVAAKMLEKDPDGPLLYLAHQCQDGILPAVVSPLPEGGTKFMVASIAGTVDAALHQTTRFRRMATMVGAAA